MRAEDSVIESETVVASVLIQNVEGLVIVFESQEGFAAVPEGTSEGEETPRETAIWDSATAWRNCFRKTFFKVHCEEDRAFAL